MKVSLITLLAALGISCGHLLAASFSRPDAKAQPDLFAWTDTCNVYVLRDGDAALLVNLGDGSVLEHLSELGVKKVEWVLFTDHHREQNQGASKLGPWRERGTKVAAPAAERALFERPLDFRKMNVSLGDALTIHGASFVRPPMRSPACSYSHSTSPATASATANCSTPSLKSHREDDAALRGSWLESRFVIIRGWP